MLTFILQKPGVPLSSSQAASKKHSLDVSSLHVPGAKPARPRRSIVLRRLAPNCEKSHVRPSWPPKSAWQEAHDSDPPSRAVLATSPCRAPSAPSASKGGTAPCAPPASRAAVVKRIFPSSSDGATG